MQIIHRDRFFSVCDWVTAVFLLSAIAGKRKVETSGDDDESEQGSAKKKKKPAAKAENADSSAEKAPKVDC